MNTGRISAWGDGRLHRAMQGLRCGPLHVLLLSLAATAAAAPQSAGSGAALRARPAESSSVSHRPASRPTASPAATPTTQTSTRATPPPSARPPASRPAVHALTPAMAQCFEWASRRYGMSAHLLHAIALQESGLNPRAVNRNTNGSTDIGLMQINSSWAPVLARYGIRTEDLWDPCTNILVGAWILGDNLVRLGPTVEALGAYNARDPVKRAAYAGKVLQRLYQLSPPRALSAAAQAEPQPSFQTSP